MSGTTIRRIRLPVKRERAEYYLLLTLASFAISVILTRLLLELTGYPQLGNSEFHIAHVLWGGLLLFLATLLPLVFANRWAYPACAVLSGVGVGLFIDEVGKFITQNNNYFYPLAAPIIYAFFLLTVMLYLQVRRPAAQNPRAEMYRALDFFMEVLDNDLDPTERADLDNLLNSIASQTERPELAQLASDLQQFLRSDALVVVPDRPNVFERLAAFGSNLETRLLGPKRLRLLLVIAFVLLSVSALTSLFLSIIILVSPSSFEAVSLQVVQVEQQVRGATSLNWYFVRVIVEALIGVFYILTAGLLLTRRERLSMHLGTLALLLSLTTVNLLNFYFDQFSTVFLTLIQMILLAFVHRYRTRYLPSDSGPEQGDSSR